jgi:hypothetical protein
MTANIFSLQNFNLGTGIQKAYKIILPIENKKTHKNLCWFQNPAEKVAESLFEKSNAWKKNEGIMAHWQTCYTSNNVSVFVFQKWI